MLVLPPRPNWAQATEAVRSAIAASVTAGKPRPERAERVEGLMSAVYPSSRPFSASAAWEILTRDDYSFRTRDGWRESGDAAPHVSPDDRHTPVRGAGERPLHSRPHARSRAFVYRRGRRCRRHLRGPSRR